MPRKTELSDVPSLNGNLLLNLLQNSLSFKSYYLIVVLSMKVKRSGLNLLALPTV